MRILVITSLVSALALVLSAGASGSPGDLDGAFGTGGVARTDIGVFDSASDLVVQPDGKILAAGTVDWNGTRNVIVARYLPGGALDTGFGSGGIVVPDRYHQVAPRLALQADGKIVVATRGESAGGPVFVYRFDANGAPDSGFGSSGIAVMSAPTGVSVASVAGVDVTVGKIIVALRTSLFSGKGVVGLARFNGDGSPDVSFGSSGFVNAELAYTWLPLAFALQPDGRMVVGGYASIPGRSYLDAFVARFAADGVLDTSFDTDGIAVLQRPTNGTEFQALGVATDGSIVAGGREWGSTYNQNQWLLTRFTGQGALDSGFGSGGVALYDPGSGDDAILDLAVTAAGIYATGWSDSGPLGLPVALFDTNGGLDAAFGTSGFAGLSGQFTRGAWRLAVQDDGEVLVLGTVQSFEPTFNQDLYLARYEGGSTDKTPPSLTLPSAVLANATSPAGAVVSFSASATDTLDPNPVVSCSPPSGSQFGIGDTTVSCTATDATGNLGSGSFTVHVKGAPEQVAELIALVDNYKLGQLGSALHEKLVNVQTFLAANKPERACNVLDRFIAQVKEQRGKRISLERADRLTLDARRIKVVIGC